MFNRVCLAGLAQTLLSWLPGRIVLPLAGAALLAFGGQLAWGQVVRVQPSSTPPMADTYPLGDDIEFEVTFDQNVTVTGTPVLKFLMGGAPPSPAVTERDAAYVSGTGTPVLRFSYEVQSRDLDLDGISMNADALVGGTITGTSTTPVVRSLTNLPPRWHTARVDGVVPTVTGRTITSLSGGDNTYAQGETVEVTLSFSEPVNATTPTLALTIGTKTASADLVQPGEARNRLVFRYEVVAGDLDTDGLAIAAGGTSLAGGAITDIAGNPANRSFSALSAQSRHQVDAVAATVSAVTIVSNAGADATYHLNERIEVAVQFSEPVRTGGSTALDIQIGNPPQRPLRTRRAAYHRRTGENTLVYRYTVGSGDMDADGISIARNAISGDVTDVPGNAASLSHDPIAEQADHRINGGADTTPPRATGVSFTGADENGWYELGDTITATVSFDETVDVREAVEGLLVLDLTIGSNIRATTWDNTTNGSRALRFTYVVRADDLDANGISVAAGAQSLRGAEIEDSAGHSANRNFPAVGNQRAHKVDGIVPVVNGVTIASNAGSDGTYKKGDTIDVRVAFSETVNVVHSARLRLAIQIGANPRQADVYSGNGSRNLTFRYRVQDDDVDEDGITVVVNALSGGTFRDPAGNEWNTATFQGLPAAQVQHQVDGDEPEITAVTITSDAGGDDTYVQGDTIDLDVTFDQPVTVQGSPELLLVFADDEFDPDEPGRPGPRRRARLVRSTPTVLTFSYVVVAGDIDRNGISVDEDPLVGGTIRDVAGNLADRSFDGFGEQAEHMVDAVAPAPTDVLISSTPRNGHTYGAGEIIEVSVTFDEEVSVTDGPALRLSIGPYTRRAPYATGSGTRTLVFRYQVQGADSDDDGISIGPNALAGTGGVIEDHAGTAMTRGIQPVGPQSSHRVDGSISPPPVGVVNVRFTSNPRSASNFYTAGEAVEVSVWFNTIVFVAEPREPDEDAELRLVLGIGQHSRYAVYVEGSGTNTLIFRHVVEAGDFDEDGIAIGPSAVAAQPALTGGRIEDADGTVADRFFRGLPANADHKVDAIPPGAARPPTVTVSNPPPDQSYGLGEIIELAVRFNEPVFVNEADSQLELVLGVGTRSPNAEFVDGAGTNTLTFRYIVRQGDFDEDGISVGPGAVVGAGVFDRAGNEWVEDARRIVPLSPHPNHKVNSGEDGVAPRISSLSIVSTPADGQTFRLEEAITVNVVFSEPVFVTGQPTVALSIGALVREAAFVSGSGTRTLVFSYLVQREDFDGDGVSIGPSALALGTSGAIVDAGGNAAVLDSRPSPAASNPPVEGGGDGAPAISDVNVVTASPMLGVHIIGDSIDVAITFNQVVHVTGAPMLALSIGADTRQATYHAGSGTTRLTFRYIVRAGDYDDDGISIGAGPTSLTGGVIQDDAGNEARRTFRAIARDAEHRVGARQPQVVRVSIDPAGARAYVLGDSIDIKVAFTEVVHVTGQPTLAVAIGPATRRARLLRGSGTDTLTFRYVVQASDYDEDGIAIAAGPASLAGGTIQGRYGNDVERTFAALHSEGHTVFARPAAVSRVAIASTPEDRAYHAGDTIVVNIVFDNIVHVTGQPTLALSIGAATRPAAFSTGSGTDQLAFNYVVQPGDYDEDGVSIAAGPGSLAGGTIQDGAGSDAVRTFSALATDPRHTVDARPPAVAAVSFLTEPAGGVYLAGDTVVVEVTFTETVHVTGQPVLVLSIGAASRQAAYVSGSGSADATLTFGYLVQADDFDEDGISIGAGPGSLSGGTIQDRNGNDAVRDFEAKAADPNQRVGIISLPAQPTRTLIVGNPEVIDLAEVFGLPISFGCVDQCTNDANVATATVARSLLTIVPLAEGTATITIAGTFVQVTVEFPVVVQADPAEVTVLEHALAAFARGLLSGASNTLGTRLESVHRRAGASMGGRRISTTRWPRANQRWAQAGASDAPGAHSAFDAPDAHSAFGANAADSADWPGRQGVFLDRLLGGSSFEMSLIANRGTKWSVWGAGDLHAFEGKPEAGSYDGSLTSAYLGVDVEGAGWIAGAAFSRNSAEADYSFTSDLGAGGGTVETTLNVVHPYVQWSLGQRGRIWAMAGIGVGEASFRRDASRSAQRPPPSDLTLRMGMAGLRSELLQFDKFELALRGDAGIVSLATDDGPTALDGLAVSAQRVRVGVEAGYALESTGGGILKPFLDLGGRFDGGDGQTGFGVEVAAGVRYRSATVGFEAKARTLAMHSADDYSETGASAMLMVTPGTGGKGLRFSVAPRWGGAADGQELFWNQDDVFRDNVAGNEHRSRDKWGVAARVGYGFGLRRGKGAVAPFVEYDLNQRDRKETRFGIGYVAERDRRMQFDVSGARVSSPHGTEQRWLLTLRGRL